MGVLESLKKSSFVHLLFAITFFTSGIIINILQSILYLGLKPFSKYYYRKINYYLCYSFYCQLVFMAEWWSGTELTIYIDKNDFDKYYGKEHGYLLMNHSYEIDWLIGWMFCDRIKMLGNCKAYAKKSIQYIPTLGWAWKFAESVFLERSWDKDKETIGQQISELGDYPDTMWLLLYAEGTRFTAEKLELSQKFAKEKGLPILKHHLTPRTKGFTASIPHLRGKVDALYDIQLAFNPKAAIKPTMTNLLRGEKVEAHIRYYSLLNTIFWALIVLVPMLYYLVKLFISGSTIAFTFGVGIIVLFFLLMYKTIGMSEISKSSSYGAATSKKTN
ncbi:Similar to AGPAT3: 1-acyl-sn-glycerol-3-phosphate acyltransferase gamma (Homo sapiens) [Cotesia congregata]|uniref:Similar to AGPAT3: 1-acyl-sn-glycerol-3-phosphate acyltransferase gamma (Homo sapiens) n=1 Tax=Cotesia congregata TaxID=51543 RepID=A0A8J2MMY9_COTCN|nr:Similar to AGPAT3: 1-acyl-sn-glycerol-3-phosphate acyltransferase gamma (Homo sapiens) [Cotesia congregata]